MDLASAVSVRTGADLELLRLQKEPGAHPLLLQLRAPCYTRYSSKGFARWRVEGEGFTKHASVRLAGQAPELDDMPFPRCWLDPVLSLGVFNLVLKLTSSAPLKHNLDDEYKCVYRGAVSSVNIDEYVYNPFAWAAPNIESVQVVVSWIHRRITYGLKDLRPPDILFGSRGVYTASR